MQRREFVRLASAAAAVVVAGDGVWYAVADRQPQPHQGTPYSAWSDWNAEQEPKPLNLVRAAILSASPHNTQPWRFRVGDNFVELHLETARSVRGLDPYLREAYLGMGCALENLLLAASANGYMAKVSLVDGELSAHVQPPTIRLVARVDLSPAARQVSELYLAIPHRHTNRSPYDLTRSLPATLAGELMSACCQDEDVRMILVQEPAQQEELVRISASANLELYSDPDVESGNEEWIRWRSRDVQRFQDGLTIENFGLSPLGTAMARLAPVSMLKRAASPEHRSALYAKQMQSARMMGLIAVRNREDMRQSVLAGRMWQRVHLLATARGIGARPCNEAIEMIDHERFLGKAPERELQLSRVTGDPSWQPTFLFLMGYPTQPAHPSPRRPAELTELS